MSFPPFPEQDLAKLVLGYLVEEQLMTTYDEFLQASPYLDAYTNEYDRLCMISLKNILAEYRAMRMYVESCKPLSLRKKLLRCSNLIDMLKLLIQYVDLNSLCEQNRGDVSAAKLSNHSQMVRNPMKTLDAIHKANLGSGHEFYRHLSNDVETTSLNDLPGNANTRCNILESSSLRDNEGVKPLQHCANTYGGNQCNCQISNTKCDTDHSKRISNAGTFQEFAVGAKDHINSTQHSNTSVNRMNSSQSNTVIFPIGFNSSNIMLPATSDTQTNLILQVTTSSNNKIRSQQIYNVTNKVGSDATVSNSNIISKPEESKITILSDVKIDPNKINPYNKSENAISSNLLPNSPNSSTVHLQTIYVNGAPASDSRLPRKFSFTKDEIMAMPTVILMPNAASSQAPGNSTDTTDDVEATSLTKPLMIDTDQQEAQLPTAQIDLSEDTSDELLLKTAEPGQNTSVPKELQLATTKNSTPQVARPIRKSSSTPRRSSHVRVLDFTTPRRLLQETISENATDLVETVISRSPNMMNLEVDKPLNGDKKCSTENTSGEDDATKENKSNMQPVLKKSWDSDLRVLISNCEPNSSLNPSSVKSESKQSKPRKKKSDDGSKNKKVKSGSSKNKSVKIDSKRKSKKSIDKKATAADVPNDVQSVDIPVKPFINIITKNIDKPSRNTDELKKDNKVIDGNTLTPDMDHISLQNEIVGRLNISDLLETPFKQALYDIQMDTPKFINCGMLDEPISDIKIMNIPTPRFMDTPGLIATPKHPQATPSSYSSRPTDYSSGGSYYKPDDNDYPPLPDELYPPVTSSPMTEEDNVAHSSRTVQNDNVKKIDSKRSSRPIRQCTKNVSYFNSPLTNKTRSQKEDCHVSENNGNIGIETSSTAGSDNKDVEDPLQEQQTNTEVKRKKKPKKSPSKKITPKVAIKLKSATKKYSAKSKKTESSSSLLIKSQTQKKTTSKDKSSGNFDLGTTTVPTKSRRKSSTPRKLHNNKHEDVQNRSNEVEDINKIKEFIEESSNKKNDEVEGINLHIECEPNGDPKTFHIDLLQRGFDLETAKRIEHDLLYDTSSKLSSTSEMPPSKTNISNEVNTSINNTIESKSSTEGVDTNINYDEEELDFSFYNCNPDTENYIEVYHKEGTICNSPVTLKETFCMEVCIEDVAIRLRATPFIITLNEECTEDMENQSLCHQSEISDIENVDTNSEETEMAVRSISNIDRLYTPRKVMTPEEQAQCLNIFDSTLTSLDTPLKAHSPAKSPISNQECGITNVVEAVEAVEQISKSKQSVAKKRKRKQSDSISDDSQDDSKKSKQEYPTLSQVQKPYLSIDIETVLCKLHGS